MTFQTTITRSINVRLSLALCEIIRNFYIGFGYVLNFGYPKVSVTEFHNISTPNKELQVSRLTRKVNNIADGKP